MMRVKRFMALLVVIATLASLCTFSVMVNAEETALPTIEVTQEDLLLIEKLEALGVISNEYDPASYVTRRDMTDIITRYMSLSVSGKNNAVTPFRDVSKNDKSYNSICALYDMGVITGDDELRFRPDDYVTYDEALVFVISAVGHKTFALREGGYPTGYHRIAIKHGMLKNLSARPGEKSMTLIDVYRMLEAALSAAAVEASYFGDGDVRYTFSQTDTFLSEVYGIRMYRDIVTGNEYTYLDNPNSNLSDEQIAVGASKRAYETPGYYYDYFLGYTVDYYVRENSDTGVYEMVYIEETSGRNNVIEIDAEDLLPAKTTFSKIYYEDANEKEKNISISGIDVIYNNKCHIDYTDLEEVLPTAGHIKALDNDDDGVYEVLFVYEYESHAVVAVDTYRERISTDVPTSEQIDLDSSKHKVYIVSAADNKRLQLKDIKKGDVVSVLESYGTEKAITVYVSNKVVTGKTTSYDAQLGYLIDGNYYKPTSVAVAATLSLGLSGNFYLDMYDEIVKYEYAADNEESMLAVMSAVRYEVNTFGTDVQVRIFTQEGKFLEEYLSENVRVDNIKYDLTDSEDVDLLLQEITNDPGYNLTRAYLLKFTRAADGKIASIEKGGITGPGHLNIIDDASTSMTTRAGSMLTMTKSGGGYQSAFYNQNKGITFTAPADGDLANLEEYSVGQVKVTVDKVYGNPNYVALESFAAYTYDSAAVMTVDIFLFRGMGGVSSAWSPIAAIEDISVALDEDDVPRKVLYMSNGQKIILENDITVIKNSTNNLMTAEQATTSVLPNLPLVRPGIVVECNVNSDGYAEEIKVIAEPTLVAGEVTMLPTFAGSTTFMSGTNLANAGVTSNNYVVGTVTGVDPDNKIMQFVAGNTNAPGAVQHVCRTSSAGITVYMIESGKTAEISLSDILPGDKFVTNIKGYNFDPKSIVIFR